MKEQISRDDLYSQNTIGIKLEKQKRVYKSDIPFHTETKEVLRTKYLNFVGRVVHLMRVINTPHLHVLAIVDRISVIEEERV